MKKILLALTAVVAVAMLVLAATASADVPRSQTQTGTQTVRLSAGVVVPNVVGLRMDRATRTLHARGLRVNEECSGLFGCIVKSQWWVCSQDPRPGVRVGQYSTAVIYAERRGGC